MTPASVRLAQRAAIVEVERDESRCGVVNHRGRDGLWSAFSFLPGFLANLPAVEDKQTVGQSALGQKLDPLQEKLFQNTAHRQISQAM